MPDNYDALMRALFNGESLSTLGVASSDACDTEDNSVEFVKETTAQLDSENDPLKTEGNGNPAMVELSPNAVSNKEEDAVKVESNDKDYRFKKNAAVKAEMVGTNGKAAAKAEMVDTNGNGVVKTEAIVKEEQIKMEN